MGTLKFGYDQKVIEQLKQVAGARWGQTMGCWYVPEGQFDLHAFFEALKGMAFIDYSGLKQERKKPPKEEKVIKGERLSLSIGRPREANPLPSVLSKPNVHNTSQYGCITTTHQLT